MKRQDGFNSKDVNAIQFKKSSFVFLNYNEEYILENNLFLILKVSGTYFSAFYLMLKYYNKRIALVNRIDTQKEFINKELDITSLLTCEKVFINSQMSLIDDNNKLSYETLKTKNTIHDVLNTYKSSSIVFLYQNEFSFINTFLLLQNKCPSLKSIVISNTFFDFMNLSLTQFQDLSDKVANCFFNEDKFMISLEDIVNRKGLKYFKELGLFYEYLPKKLSELRQIKHIYFVNVETVSSDLSSLRNCFNKVLESNIKFVYLNELIHHPISNQLLETDILINKSFINKEANKIIEILLKNEKLEMIYLNDHKKQLKIEDKRIQYWEDEISFKEQLFILDKTISSYNTDIFINIHKYSGIISQPLEESYLIKLNNKHDSLNEIIIRQLELANFKVIFRPDEHSYEIICKNSLNYGRLSLNNRIIHIKVNNQETFNRIITCLNPV